jgi:hypothetical protein
MQGESVVIISTIPVKHLIQHTYLSDQSDLSDLAIQWFVYDTMSRRLVFVIIGGK